MSDLSTLYMGLKLRNPIIVGSCDLSMNADAIGKCADCGAGAVVTKSVFEEQFLLQGGIPHSEFAIHPEALDYMRSTGLLEYGPEKICREIERAKKKVDIPLIASINCQTSSLWPRFAKQLQEAGADALELNIYQLPIEPDIPGSEQEDRYVAILQEIKKEVSIPVSVKLSIETSSLPYLGKRLSKAGSDALVFFNWFVEPDIDIQQKRALNRKGKGNFNQSLRWVALLSGRIDTDIAASGGIGSGSDIIKHLLAGASAVQICTLFYQKGLEEIQGLLHEMESWMQEHGHQNLKDFQGELSFKNQELSFHDLGEAGSYFRAQYLKTYS